jgi:hypothetical protein
MEMKKMPHPFPDNDFIFSHKGLPAMNFPLHLNDVRYNFIPDQWPRRHFVHSFKFKQYNFNDFDEIMHGIQFAEFELDMQLADPISSNHYYKNRAPSFVFFLVGLFFVYVVSK